MNISDYESMTATREHIFLFMEIFSFVDIARLSLNFVMEMCTMYKRILYILWNVYFM